MKKGVFDFKLKLDDEKIIDQKVNSSKDLDHLFKDLSRKFK